jgi:alanine dehydrogenase
MLTSLLLRLLLLLLADVHAHHHVAGRLGAAGQVAAAMPQPAGGCAVLLCTATHGVEGSDVKVVQLGYSIGPICAEVHGWLVGRI